jgi:antitoxin PrlF
MRIALEEVSTITAKGQTTIPKAVRQALGVDYGDQIAFVVDETGVHLTRAQGKEDPAITAFLELLANDLTGKPETINSLSPVLAARLVALQMGEVIDVDDPIIGDVAL